METGINTLTENTENTENTVTTTKRCARCGEERPLTEFGHNSARPDKRSVYCAACRRKAKREYNERIERVRLTGRKTCAGCGKEKPLTEFFKSTRNKDGFMSLCKECSSEKNREWRLSALLSAEKKERRPAPKPACVTGPAGVPEPRMPLQGLSGYSSGQLLAELRGRGYVGRLYNLRMEAEVTL